MVMVSEQMQDFLLQSVMLFLVVIALFLFVAQSTDLTMFYLRFYGKDLGTIVEAVYGAKGDVLLTYSEIHPDQRYLFNFTKEALFLSSQQNLSNLHSWMVRQQYGYSDKPVLSGSLLLKPIVITFHKDDSVFDFGQGARACPDAYNTVLQVDTRLILQFAPEFGEVKKELEQDESVKQMELNAIAKKTVTIIINKREVVGSTASSTDSTTGSTGATGSTASTSGEPTLTYGSKTDPLTAEHLACLFESHLKPSYSLLRSKEMKTPPEESTITLQLTIPELKGADSAVLAKAILLSLHEASR